MIGRLKELLVEDRDCNKQMLCIAPVTHQGNKFFVNLAQQSDDNTRIELHYYHEDIIHPGGYVECDGVSIEDKVN